LSRAGPSPTLLFMHYIKWAGAILPFFLWTGAAMAKASSSVLPLPTATVFPNAVGILFPGFNVAAGVNPAALPLAGKVVAVQAGFTPPLQAGDPNAIFGGLAVAKKGLGVGLGYLRGQSSSEITQGVFGGVGFSFENVSFGLGLRDSNVSGGFSPNVDIGFIVGNQKSGKGVSFGGVFYNLDSLAQLALGIGYGSVKKYSIEATVLIPPFDFLDSGYVFTASANLRAELLGIYFRTSYATISDHFSHTIGLAAWVSEQFNLFAQFTTTRTLTLGATVVF